VEFGINLLIPAMKLFRLLGNINDYVYISYSKNRNNPVIGIRLLKGYEVKTASKFKPIEEKNYY